MFLDTNLKLNIVNHKIIKSLVELQLQILENVKDNIKPGGTIVYSTCTIEQMENEMSSILFKET